MIKFFCLFIFFSSLVYSAVAFAVLTINICGHSTYECQLPDCPAGGCSAPTPIVPDLSVLTVDSFGPAGFVQIVDVDGSIIRVPIGGHLDVPAPSAPPTMPPTVGPELWCQSHTAAGVNRGCGTLVFGSETKLAECLLTGFSSVAGNGQCIGTSGYVGSLGLRGGAVSCETGYVIDGSQTVCNLADARAAVADNRQDFSRVGDAYSGYAGDKTGNSIASVAGDMVNYSTNASGSNALASVQALVGGGSKISLSSQLVDGNGANYVNTRSVNFGGNGLVYSSQSFNTAGTLSQPLGTTNVIFPSDYARSGEAAAAAAGLGIKLDGIGSQLGVIASSLSQTQTMTELVPPDELDAPGWSSTFDSLKGWSLPSHSSQCPQPSVDLSGLGLGVHVFNSHCGLMADMGVVLHQSMQIVFTVLALFLVLSA